ncbi:MAG: DsbA family protein [Defluviitaleaceae bacterium]|nr:DsbA family protein [Defluviitaleaceae bacterium]
MKKLEIFFDYNCPYCFKGHNNLLGILPDNPNLEIVWQPCEIYERPKNYSGMYHTDLCIQAMFFAVDIGLDILKFNEKMYNIIFNERVNVENADNLADALADILDAAQLKQALKTGKYAAQLKQANNYAFKVKGVQIVPSYSADGGKLQDRQEFFGLPY